jgi:hypothetical protein
MKNKPKTGSEILNSEEWQNADLPMRRIIFVREVASTPEFADASADIQQKIIERFGINEPSAAPKPAEAAAPQDALDDAGSPPVSDPNLENQLFGELNIPQLPPADQNAQQQPQGVLSRAITDFPYSIAGGVLGAEAGRRELSAAKSAPRVAEPGSPGQKWKTKTGYGKGEGYTVQEVAEAYERAKNKGKISSKISPGRPLGIEGWAEQKKLAEELASKNKLAEGAQKATRLLGKVPFGSTLMGAGAGLEGKQAYDAYQQGDYPLAAIHGVGALGSAASLIPHPATRLGGGALSLLSVPAAEMYKRFKK